jgi:hypothetical protein
MGATCPSPVFWFTERDDAGGKCRRFHPKQFGGTVWAKDLAASLFNANTILSRINRRFRFVLSLLPK